MRDLVLVGGGHAHVQVIRRWMMRPLPGVRLSVVLDRPEAVYSGMVPGFAAGEYAVQELEIDVLPLARRAAARVILSRALGVDPGARRIEIEGRPAVHYDVASLDVGSTVRGLDLPGVADHALATRPIRSFVDRLEERLDRATAGGGKPLALVIVGGGAAGIELALTLEARLRARRVAARVSVLCASAEILPGQAAGVSARVRSEAARRGIEIRCGARVLRVEKDSVELEGKDERVPADVAVWATGAVPTQLLSDSPLPRGEDGFVRVDEMLRVEGHDDLFAVGDCAALIADPWVPKAGVYAVREGPVLDANLRARLTGGRLRRYRPQRDFLCLLNLGEGRALGAKWGLVSSGWPVWRLKDWIDRRFVRRFRVLDPSGAPAAGFPSPESMGMEEMPCGGCAAKVGASALERALARLDPPLADASVISGLDPPDDVAALRLPGGDVVLATLDAFRAFTDDPWLVGRVAALNAASDVWAKGGIPRHALAVVTVPEEDPLRAEEALFQVLCGVRAGLDPHRIALVGGHSTSGEELFVGLSITGELEPGQEALGQAGLRPGDALVLSKPLGTGVLLAADMRGLLSGAHFKGVVESMLRPNAAAARIARQAGARACTDVSGFGLAGHLATLLRPSRVSARLCLADVPLLAGARALVERGVRSTFHEQNATARVEVAAAGCDTLALELLFDPQTSGGLLFGVAPEGAEEVVRTLREAGDRRASVIGKVTPEATGGALLHVD